MTRSSERKKNGRELVTSETMTCKAVLVSASTETRFALPSIASFPGTGTGTRLCSTPLHNVLSRKQLTDQRSTLMLLLDFLLIAGPQAASCTAVAVAALIMQTLDCLLASPFGSQKCWSLHSASPSLMHLFAAVHEQERERERDN